MLNDKVEGLLLENAKLQSTLKGFTDSLIYMDIMLDGIGNFTQRQGLGFKPKKMCKKGNPTVSLRRELLMCQVILMHKMTHISLMNPTLKEMSFLKLCWSFKL